MFNGSENLKDSTMGNQQETVTESERGWLAGIIDGEGCFHMGKSDGYYNPRLQIDNTSPLMLSKVASIMYRLGLYYKTSKCADRGNEKHKKAERVEITGFKSLAQFFKIMLPYIVNKQDEAQKMSEYCTYRLNTKYEDIDLVYTQEVFEYLRDIKKL